jgi:chromosome segregation ATPase
MMNEVDILKRSNIPDGFKDIMSEKSIMTRLENKLSFFDLSELQSYLSIIKASEIHRANVEMLNRCEHEASIYRNSGVDTQLDEIKRMHQNIAGYRQTITSLESELGGMDKQLGDIDHQIGLVTKFQDGIRYKKIVEQTLADTNKILVPLESSSSERVELTYKIHNINSTIQTLRDEAKMMENKINEYHRLVEEGSKLSSKHHKLNIIMEAVSTKKGIPLIYMNTYLGKIQKMTNELLSIIYDDELSIGLFDVNSDTFDIPFIRNGVTIPDVRYASQSEVSLITIAISFALADNAIGTYNIPLFDEVDAGLDDKNQLAFLEMLYRLMEKRNAEQVFIISHKMSGMMNVPMDIIKLSDTGPKTKLQNIIYE